ncbi:hypothetical protein BD413DRAFT_91101 [Trametes elegans]|nr:hypothetical protein BD413DRAFT_91101 [Trametes elegans]
MYVCVCVWPWYETVCEVSSSSCSVGRPAVPSVRRSQISEAGIEMGRGGEGRGRSRRRWVLCAYIYIARGGGCGRRARAREGAWWGGNERIRAALQTHAGIRLDATTVRLCAWLRSGGQSGGRASECMWLLGVGVCARRDELGVSVVGGGKGEEGRGERQ